MNRKDQQYKVKSFGLKVEDIDEGSRKVVGYLSAFDVLDSDQDIIRPGAFAKSIAERGPNATTNRRIAFLRMHDWNKQIGKFLELSEDETGLKFVGQMGRSTEGEDALKDYQDGIIREHSIGFRYVDGKIDYNEEKDFYEIKEANLFEGSAVTFGANEFTPTIDVAKGQDKKEIIRILSEEMGAITKALRNGKGTDERLYNLEMRLAVLNQKYSDFFDSIKPGSETPTLQTEKKEDDKAEKVKLFYLKMLQSGKIH